MSDELIERAERIIPVLVEAVASGDPAQVEAALKDAPLVRLAVGLAYELYRREVADAARARDIQTLASANTGLFRERRKLRDRIEHLEEINESQAALLAGRRGRKKTA